jgi:hypothetical protein
VRIRRWATLPHDDGHVEANWRTVFGWFRSHASREAEIMFLRQQLLVLTRSAPTRLKLRPADRLIFVMLYRLFPALLGAAVIFRPETLVRWHRSGFRRYWRWKSRRRVGRQQSKPNCHPRPRADSQPRKSTPGCTADPWRVAEARYRRRPVDGRQVHDPATAAAFARLANIPAQSNPAHRSHRSIRRPD